MAQEQGIRSFYDSINTHNLDQFVTFFSDDAQFKDISTGQVYRGKSEIRAMATDWLKAFSDMKLNVSSIIGSGDNFAVELTLTGTHNGPMSGPQGEIPATGKKVNVPTCDLIRLRNGKIQSLNCYFAATILMNQIGILSSSAAA